jgi:hypothetical protein
VNTLSWVEEVFYRRLHSVADDYGRFSAHPSLLRAACYPLRLNDVSDRDVSKWLASCAAKGLLLVYEVEGKPYLEIVKFEQRVRADKSKYPQRTDTCQSPVSSPPSSAPVVEDVVDSRKTRDKATRARRVSLPENFGNPFSPAMQTWLENRGEKQVKARLIHFNGYAKANGKQYADWEQAFQNAVREDWAKLNALS